MTYTDVTSQHGAGDSSNHRAVNPSIDSTHLLDALRRIIVQARHDILHNASHTMTLAYWDIGEQIEIARCNNEGNVYSICDRLSDPLMTEFGNGFASNTLHGFHRFHRAYPNRGALSPKLLWSHYFLLSKTAQPLRGELEAEVVEHNWSARDLISASAKRRGVTSWVDDKQITIREQQFYDMVDRAINPFDTVDDAPQHVTSGPVVAQEARLSPAPTAAPPMYVPPTVMPAYLPAYHEPTVLPPTEPYPIKPHLFPQRPPVQVEPTVVESQREAKANHAQIVAQRAAITNGVIDDLLHVDHAASEPSLELLKVAALLMLDGMRIVYKGTLARAVDECDNVPGLLRLMAHCARSAILLDNEARTVSVNVLAGVWLNSRLQVDQRIDDALRAADPPLLGRK